MMRRKVIIISCTSIASVVVLLVLVLVTPYFSTPPSKELNKTIQLVRIDTQCSDPWENMEGVDLEQFREYVKTHPEYKFNDFDETFIDTAHLIEKYYEMKGIEIKELAVVEQFRSPDFCEGCGCNAGGHAWKMLVDRSELSKIKGSGELTPPYSD